MVRKNGSPSPLLWIALALLAGAAGGAEPASATRFAQWLCVRLTDHSAITAAVRTADQSHFHAALAPANAPSILSNDSCIVPATERQALPPASSLANAGRAPPGASLPTENC